MALSKLQLQKLSPTAFLVLLRVPIVAMLLPFFIWDLPQSPPPVFWLILLAGGVSECLRMLAVSHGVQRDYYSTYALLNTSPLFVLLMAPRALGEKLSPWLIAGALCVVAGAVIFYWGGRLRLAALGCGLIQAIVTVLCKAGLNMAEPFYFMFLMCALSTLFLSIIEARRTSVSETGAAFVRSIRHTIPLSLLNLIAIITFVWALSMAPATHFAILLRTSMIFGFLLSVLVLREYEGWQRKLCGAAFIVVGATLIVAV